MHNRSVIIGFLWTLCISKGHTIICGLSGYKILFYISLYRVSQEECARLRDGVPNVKLYRYNPKYLCPNLNGYGDNGQRNLKL